MDQEPSSTRGPGSWVERLWSALAGLDLFMGVLLGAMLLPLIIAPFVLVYEFVKARAYMDATLVGSLFAACVALAVRGVRRGEFGPGTLAIVLGLLATMVFIATRVPR